MLQRRVSNKRRGSIRDRDGKLFARLTWTRADGKRGEREQRIRNKTEGWRLIGEWVLELEKHGDKAKDVRKFTFSDLADHVRDRYFVEPIVREGRRISGLKNWKDSRRMLDVARAYFGKRLVRSITWGDVEQFRRQRLDEPTWRGEERSIARVNRELATLRRAFNIARAEGWIDRNPFESGKSLIEVAHEVRRDRVLTPEEEVRLLAECVGRCAHLRPIVICALDSGLRRGEIISLTAGDVDLTERSIRLQSLNTKAQRSRTVPITRRLLAELQPLVIEREPGERVFGIADNFKNAFNSACRRAKIEGLRFHDLRHTAATRWIQSGIPIATVSRLLGHADLQTTMRYVNPTPQMLADVLSIFDSHQPAHIEGNNGE
jgi:integrase